MIRYGTNPIAWSNDDDRSLGAHIPLAQCLDEAAAIGFQGIEKGHKFPADAAGLRAELDPRGLRLVSGWHSLNLLVNDVEAEREALDPALDLLLAMGAEVVIVCETSNAVHGDASRALADKPVLGAPHWERFGAGVERLAEHARSRGVQLVYHHHMGTIVQTPEEIDLLMASTGPATRLLFDTGHCLFGGGDPAAVLARHADRLGHLHAKNVRPAVKAEVEGERLSFLEGVRRGVFTVPGDPEGEVDFPAVLRVAAEAGYAGWIVIEAEQDPSVREPLRYQSMGLREIRRMAAEAGL